MINTIDQDYKQPKENLTKAQEKALEKIIKIEEEIKNKKNEITKILKANDLNIRDVSRFKIDQDVRRIQKINRK